MNADPGPYQRSEPDSRSSVHGPTTPVKRTRFADIPEEDIPRSVLTTPASCTSACSNFSSLADTPLSAKMAKMADRCIVLLDEYFAAKPPQPLSPAAHDETGNDSDKLSKDSTATLNADHPSAQTFYRYSELPNEVQDRILEEVVTVHPSRGRSMRPDGSRPAVLAVAAVSKKTREQVFRIMDRPDECCVSGLGRKGAGGRKEGKFPA